MKRTLSMLFTLVLLLSLAACGGNTIPTETLQEQLAKPMDATHYDWADSLPIMDGSTSTIPLEAGIRAALFGISIAEAELQVTHSSTYGSFENFLKGQAELVFSVPWSEEQIAQAQEKGMEPKMVPIAAEGFVFVVNAKNPVDSLTQQQIKDIYSGKITNWKEVGGNDAPIVAYQRNETSGSQNFMHTFMGDTPLMEPMTDFLPSTMGQIMDAIAYYDNAENAIGYSVYAYAADMYGNGNEIKFIHVDGVGPTKASMADGTYPLLGYNYAIYNTVTTPDDSPLRKLVDWLVTEEGQRAVQAAGYVPVHPVGEIPETVIDLYRATGTGDPKPTDFTASVDRYVVDTLSLEYREGTAPFTCFTDTEMQQELNDLVATTTSEIDPENKRSTVTADIINGYMSMEITSNDTTRWVLYDLIKGERIAFSDLFFKGADFVSVLNSDIAGDINTSTDSEDPLIPTYPTKRPFVGIPAGHDAFTLTDVVFPVGNPYFDNSSSYDKRFEFTLKHSIYDLSWLLVARDMNGVFNDSVTVRRELNLHLAYSTVEPAGSTDWGAELLNEQHYDQALCDKINTVIRERINTLFTEEYVEKYKLNKGDWRMGYSNLNTLASRYFISHVSATNFGHLGTALLFDTDTGEEVPYTALLKDGWQQQSTWSCTLTDADGHDSETPLQDAPELTDAKWLYNLSSAEGGFRLSFMDADPDQPMVSAIVPWDYINW